MIDDRMQAQLQIFGNQIQTLCSRDLEFIGVGADLCEINRMQGLYSKWNDKIAARILSEDEFNLWIAKNRSIPFLAKRWAGKEAVVKAIGVGFAKGLRWREVSILNDENGKPIVEFLGQTKALLQCQQQYIHCYISLADEQPAALGFCVAVKVTDAVLGA